jgi:proteic killer suppression protein
MESASCSEPKSIRIALIWPAGLRGMIKSILGSATRQFIERGKSRFSGLDEDLARQRLAELNAAPSLTVIGKLNSVGLHKLKGNLREFWSIDVNGRWRIRFKFKDGDAHEVHIADTH